MRCSLLFVAFFDWWFLGIMIGLDELVGPLCVSLGMIGGVLKVSVGSGVYFWWRVLLVAGGG